MISLKYISVKQKGITFYLSSSNANKIIDSITYNRKTSAPIAIQYDLLQLEGKIEEINQAKIGKGLQRELIGSKVASIRDYLHNEFGLIPNSVILNISDPLNLVEFSHELIVPDDESIIITVLDGQHRVEGVREYLRLHPSEEYDIPLTIFYNGELEFQAYLFSVINSTQTKINKSFLYDLLSLTRKQIDEFKLSHEIAYWLNSNDNSSLKSNLKLLGKGAGWLSQAAFIDYLMPNLYLSDTSSNSNVVFRRYLKQKKYNKIAEFISDYFKAIKGVYVTEFDSPQFIFKTSFVFGLFMRLMPYAFIYSVDLDTFDYDMEKLYQFISIIKAENIDFSKGGPNSGIGSLGRQKALFKQILDLMQKHIDLNSLVSQFQKQNL